MNAETLRSTTKKKVPRTAFHNHTGQYPDISRREPITATKHGRPGITIVEAAYFERLVARPSVARVLDEARPVFQFFPYRERLPARFWDPAQA